MEQISHHGPPFVAESAFNNALNIPKRLIEYYAAVVFSPKAGKLTACSSGKPITDSIKQAFAFPLLSPRLNYSTRPPQNDSLYSLFNICFPPNALPICKTYLLGFFAFQPSLAESR